MPPSRFPRSIWLQAVVLTVTCWPLTTIRPEPGVDQSWNAALHLAAHHHLVFGRDILFTYGPLGFLGVPKLYYVGTAALGLAFVALLTWSVAATVLLLLRRTVAPLPAFVATYLLVKAVPLEAAELLPIVILVWCVIAALRDEPPWLARWMPDALGAAAALTLLVKFNGGVAALAGACLACAGRGRRDFARAIGAFAVGLLILWTATGGTPAALWEFLRGSLDISSGYSAALSTETRSVAVDVAYATALCTALLVAAWRQSPRPRRLPATLTLLVLLGLELKHGFVRHDGGHIAAFFVACMLVPLGWWRTGMRNIAIGAISIAAVMSFYGTALAYGDTSLPSLATQFDPVHQTTEMLHQTATIALPNRAGAFARRARRAIVTRLRVDQATQAALAGHTVHVDPWETSLIWALSLRWAPPPVFQTYSAYTPRLDERNAASLLGPNAPERILRPLHPVPVDSRWPAFESPLYFRTLLCNYVVASAQPSWQVLQPSANRCGQLHRVGTSAVVPDRPVAVPVGDEQTLVSARIACAPTLRYRLQNLLLKPTPTTEITLDGGQTWLRLILATAGDGLVLRTPATDHTVPGNLSDYTVQTIRLRGLPGPCSVSFWAQSMAPPG